jgi:glucokinase-like ROK family protein
VNKLHVIGHIRRGPISRAELAEALDVSRSTVSAVINDLIGAGLVIERGAGVSRGGRRPIVLDINPEAGRVVGIDLGATHVLATLADLHGRVVAETQANLNVEQGPEACLPQVMDFIRATLDRAGCPPRLVRAIALGVPGPVLAAEGSVSAPPIMPGWDDFPIRHWIEQHWPVPISVENDADLGALGEWTFGAGQGQDHLAYIKLGTGIGCGLLLGGQLYRGALGTAGEIGHFTITEDGPPCSCGNYGCLEAMAGGRAIAQRAQLAVAAGQRTLLAQIERPVIAIHDVIGAAAAGDGVSQTLLADAGRLIGSALASLVNLLNPGMLVLGGGLVGAGELLLAPLRQVVAERTLHATRQAMRIELARLGRRSTAQGAVAQALSQAFDAYAGPGSEAARAAA